MGISQITSSVLVFLTGLLPASCHKTSDQAKPGAPTVAATANTNVTKQITGEIGQIILTNRSETSVMFANGASCTLTPKVIDRQNIQITLALENRKEDGETKDYSVAQVIAQEGRPVMAVVGDMNISFTPTIAEK